MPTVAVKGMRCENCRKAVAEAAAKVRGISGVRVDLEQGLLSWHDAGEAAPPLEDVKKAVRNIGFEVD
jgi:copper chaperone CopZ